VRTRSFVLSALLITACAFPERASPEPQIRIPPVTELPEPFVRPDRDILNPTRYSPGHCEHNGHSIYERTIAFDPEDFSIAVDCSQRRCETGDPIGCRDTAALLLDRFWGPPRPVQGMPYAKRGCDAGDAPSCALLAAQFEDPDPTSVALRKKICLTSDEYVHYCPSSAWDLEAEGRIREAVELLLRGCRGTLSEPIEGRGIDYGPDDVTSIEMALRPSLMRHGCGELARIADSLGDAEHAYEYDRLECLHGDVGKYTSCFRSAEIALEARGRADPATQLLLREACSKVNRSETQVELCKNLDPIAQMPPQKIR